ncbi:MAG: asparagine synthetase B [Candidatus Bathyarchaeia archaeon]
MGALAAVVSKHYGRINAASEAIKMLKALKHRGGETYGISTDRVTVITKDFVDLENLTEVKSNVALGYNFSRILPEDAPQPIEHKGCKLSFEGRIFSPQYLGTKDIAGLLERFGEIEEFARNVIGRMDGSFSFAAIKNDKLIIGRDPMGVKPLYFCENERFFALASERKALWTLGASNNSVKSFPPGRLAEITKDGIALKAVRIFEKPKTEKIDENRALERLYSLILKSLKEKTSGLGNLSIGFSGGLDSSIIAALAKEIRVNALLISVGLEGSREIEQAEKAANEIGLPLKAEVYTLVDVEAVLPRVLWLIEEPNALKASIFIPIYWTAEISSKLNNRVMLSGQGSDELFAGYYKYLREFEVSVERVKQSLYEDVLRLHESALEPEEKICSFHGIDVRFPYIDYDLASFALSLPITFKIVSQGDPLRKRILRQLAKRIGLSADIYLKPKKAIQYGTGVSRALRKIARKRGLTMQSFINKVFSEIRWAQ